MISEEELYDEAMRAAQDESAFFHTMLDFNDFVRKFGPDMVVAEMDHDVIMKLKESIDCYRYSLADVEPF
jgi:hypothetical protein